MASMRRTDVVHALRGQTFSLPDFDQIHHAWRVATSPHLSWLRQKANARIREIAAHREQSVENAKFAAKFQLADFALFAATWWPSADRDFLLLETYALLWIFMWDDEIDNEDADLGNRFGAAEVYRDQTLKYVAGALGLAAVDDWKTITDNILITSFEDIAAMLCDWTIEQRSVLYEEIEIYVKATAEEQHQRLHHSLPSYEQYIRCRMGTSGVGPICFGFLDFEARLRGQPAIAAYIACLERQVNILISIENDILSLRKELKAGTPDSTIPILWLQTQDLQAAVDDAYVKLGAARASFDSSEQALLSACPKEYLNQVHTFLDVCKTNCTGNVAWSLQSGRYGVGSEIKKAMVEL